MTPKQIEQINRGIALKIGWKKCARPFCQRIVRPVNTDDEDCELPPNFFEDERTRPQLLAALSEDELRKLAELIDRKGGHHSVILSAIVSTILLPHGELAKLFCAVKNIEIDL